MSYSFKFPDIGEGVAEGTILEWYVEVGKPIKANQPVVKVETDKVVDDIPSPRTGIVTARYGEVGEEIKVGDVLIEIETEADKAKTSESSTSQAAKSESKSEQEEEVKESVGVVGSLEEAKEQDLLPSSDEASQAPKGKSQKKKSLATPAVRALARELDIDINDVEGTGKQGRVTKEDVKKYKQAQEQPAAATAVSAAPISLSVDENQVEFQPVTQIRKTIAKKMSQSKNTAAHMSVFEEVEVSDLVALRNTQKQKFAERGTKLTYLPFIIKAVIQGLKANPTLNSKLDLANNRIIQHKQYNIGIAVDTPDGLVVPVIPNADKLSILELSKKIGELAEKARSRQLSMEDFKGGTFSITNFGSIAGTHGVPIINYPEVAILGVGRILKTPVIKDDQIQKGHILPLSLSVDHRLIDGGEATRFLKVLTQLLDDPMDLLLT